ncbi:hypothetical protein LV28_12405 [Pandoraea pnomenusa]|uniref:Uncharacterized protein n=1 Tax=Pandoraea pnomenusa TaxID=93220 RepID=A0A379KF25_9BURK|nr:hypothetical protein [Pandoraea pnomenusa]AIU27218.1 hypothetical protein LV28_12405 [Pandoraea pnomenusa]SUA78278.1 Uncharacterised protein [Pandoraea pnomenusa]SUD65884.1 Uncharacterised protein [Pandoraea pnomenusa]
MNIRTFGLPESFPEFLVPAAAVAFMLAHRGRPLEEAIDAGRALGYRPTVCPLPQMVGGWTYGFGLTVNRMVIPFVVELSDFPAGHA